MPLDAAEAHDVNLAALPPQGDRLLAELNRLRDYDPLYWSEQSRCWIVSGHAQVLEGLSGRLPLSSTYLPAYLYRSLPPQEMATRLPNTLRYMPLIITNRDGEAHVRIRKLMVKAFSRKLVESLRPVVQARVALLLDRAAAKRQVEFNEEIARLLPGAVILKLLGMDADAYLPRLKGWADAFTLALTALDPRPEWLDGLERVLTDMVGVFQAEIEDRRRNPGEDLISAFLDAVEDGQRLSMDEMLAALIQLIIDGHHTTASSMSLGLRALATHPDAWAWWRAHPERGVTWANELMRYIAMSTALPRVVAEDFAWEGRELKAGQLVMLMVAAGNHDPAENPEPERLDFSRPNYVVLTFGPGIHHCVGHLLAKLQLSEFFGALTARFDGAEVEEPQFLPNLVFRGVSALNVRFL